jgi:hypothetical protein
VNVTPFHLNNFGAKGSKPNHTIYSVHDLYNTSPFVRESYNTIQQVKNKLDEWVLKCETESKDDDKEKIWDFLMEKIYTRDESKQSKDELKSDPWKTFMVDCMYEKIQFYSNFNFHFSDSYKLPTHISTPNLFLAFERANDYYKLMTQKKSQ